MSPLKWLKTKTKYVCKLKTDKCAWILFPEHTALNAFEILCKCNIIFMHYYKVLCEMFFADVNKNVVLSILSFDLLLMSLWINHKIIRN